MNGEHRQALSIMQGGERPFIVPADTVKRKPAFRSASVRFGASLLCPMRAPVAFLYKIGFT
jgi:hypothetical protein